MGQTFTTDILGDETEVMYDYDGGDPGDYYQPPEPPSVEITSVIYKGVDVSLILSCQQIGDLEMAAMKDVEESYQSYLEDQAEAAYERRREEQLGL